ncbi:MAG: pre-toxin TG domain-containing protein [Vicinamibacterales bacterium]
MKKRTFLHAAAAAAGSSLTACVQTVPRVPTGAGGAAQVSADGQRGYGPVGMPESRRALGGLPTSKEQQTARDLFSIATQQPGAALVLASRMALNSGTVSFRQKWPSLRAGTQTTQALVQDIAAPVRQLLRAVMAQSTTERVALPKSAVPEVRNGEFSIPPGGVARFDLAGHCMDFGLPAPVKDDALYLMAASERVPPELLELYRAIVVWMDRPANAPYAQSALWTLMGAGTSQSMAVYPFPAILRAFDDAMPGGAALFQQYHEARMGPLRQRSGPVRGPDTPGDPAAVNRMLEGLVAQGNMIGDGRGVGYTMLAPGIAARGVGTDRLQGHYQIVNATLEPFQFRAAEYVAVPAVRKQAVSGTTSVKSPVIAEPALERPALPAEAKRQVDEVVAELERFIQGPEFDQRLNWLAEPARSASVMGRALAALRNVDQRHPVKAYVSAIPVLGNLMALYEAVTGQDWLHDRTLSGAERAIAALSIAPGEGALRGALGALERSGALGRIASLAGAQGGADRVKRVVDSIFESVYFNTLYGSLQNVLRAQRTDVERTRWEVARAGGDPSSLFSLSQDPANLFTWLADKAFRFETGVRDLVDRVASGRLPVPT